MLELVNLSNYSMDNNLIKNDAKELGKFLKQNNLDGIEMMLWEPWDSNLHPEKFIYGVHLRFWSDWLDFWLGNSQGLKLSFPNTDAIKSCFGGLTRNDWLALYKENISAAIKMNPKYLVFHVSQARKEELYHWKFHYKDNMVIEAIIELVNDLSDVIPEGVTLLFENLWWPGLTLLDRNIVEKLMAGIQHKNKGIMLDTGHLMNTNQNLVTQEDGVEYILQVLNNLGAESRYIKGIHLHYSLSGEYVKKIRQENITRDYSIGNIMEHVLKIDEHLPFTTQTVQKIVEKIQPQYLVHEFMQTSTLDWQTKVRTQQRALRKF
ncbi:TIM barrel protein [Anaerosinus gibii]|uniref:TIM barrel protein n=1 Tax=Selenobaculum gibii TaxID=3054208 RepID=A0A9Y2AHF4_9FIRM|nr:TIM barrel protein [Selenobaculum gbiensis]WIW69831.1 TIM barrel protein [Selenobaculum gbiensis]